MENNDNDNDKKVIVSGSNFTVFIGTIFIIWWIFGIALAKGFWSTTCSIFIPPYAWVLVVEEIIKKYWI